MAKSFDWLAQRNLAETVICPHCHAAPNTTCRNAFTNQPLEGPPAHPQRLTHARTTTQTPTTTENTP